MPPERPLLAITDCTISGNSAGSGGGLYDKFALSSSSGGATISDSTISGNTATTGGGLDIASGSTSLVNTIVAGNLQSGGTASDIAGTVAVSSSHNLIGTGGSGGLTGTNGNQVNVANPGLAPLGHYGGPLETMALLPGSPAIGTGVAVTGVTTDARGLPRPTSAGVDIGAVQDEVSLPPPTAVTVQAGIATAISLGSFNDGAGAGPYSVTVQWGDNSSPTTFSLPSTGSLGSPDHTYTNPGSDTITVTVTDANGDENSLQVTATVTAGLDHRHPVGLDDQPLLWTVGDLHGDRLLPRRRHARPHGIGPVRDRWDPRRQPGPARQHRRGVDHDLDARHRVPYHHGHLHQQRRPLRPAVDVPVGRRERGAGGDDDELSRSPPPAPAYGQAVTLTATVSPASSGGGTPGGTVTFYDAGQAIDTATLVNGTATFTASNLVVGPHSITASYGGSTIFGTSSSTPLAFTYAQATPTLTVTDAGGTYNNNPFPATDSVAGVSGAPGSSLEARDAVPGLLCGDDGDGHAPRRCAHGRRDLHRPGQLRRQHRLCRRRPDDHLHHRPGHADGDRVRCRRHLQRRALPGHGYRGRGRPGGGQSPRHEPRGRDADIDLLRGEHGDGHAPRRRAHDRRDLHRPGQLPRQHRLRRRRRRRPPSRSPRPRRRST